MKNLMSNPILDTDSYKASHFLQYPQGTQSVYSYVEPRSSKMFSEVPFVGLHYALNRIVENPVTKEAVDQAEDFFKAHGEPFNRKGWDRVVEKHEGLPPLRIDAVPEGTVVPIRNVCMTVENTDHSFELAITSYYETQLLRGTWYASTVAAITREVRRLYKKQLEQTSDLSGQDLEMKSLFALNDFGSRGVSSFESSAIGGFGHLTNSWGTDNVPAVALARDYYGCEMAGFSIPASEHSTVTCWPGQQEGEKEALRNHIKNFGNKASNPSGLYAFVSDSYDLLDFVSNVIGGELREDILAQDNTLVVRPDSGEPTEIVPEVLRRLYDKFGGSVNSKGKIVLNDKVRVIQGDGMNMQSIPVFLQAIADAGFSVENVVMGMGGGLLQEVTRDTAGWAMKCSSITINGVNYDVFKQPKTDPGKASKRGRLALIKNRSGGLETINRESLGGRPNILVPTYQNGKILVAPTLDEIRQRCAV